MSRNALSLLVVLALLGAGLFALLGGGTSRQGVEPVAPGSLARIDADPGAAPVVAPVEPSDDPDAPFADPSARSASAPRDQARRERPTRTDERPRLRLRVVDGESGLALAGIAVRARWVGSDPVPLGDGSGSIVQEDIDRRDGVQLDAIVAGEPRLETDGEGYVQVPAPLGGTSVVVARTQDRWGRRVLDEWDGTEEAAAQLLATHVEELELRPDLRLVVRVVDEVGAPLAGVPVVLQERRWSSWSTARTETTEAPAGEARFEHLGPTLAALDDDSPPRITLDVLAAEPPARALDPENLPREPMVLQLERGGSVTLTVLDPEPGRAAPDGQVALRLMEAGQSRRTSAFTRERGPASVTRPYVGRALRFDHVALGRELEVSITSDEDAFGTHAFRQGPTRPGETTALRVTLGEDHPLVRVRLVDVDGEPQTNLPVTVRQEETRVNFGYTPEHELTSDGSGGLRFGVEPGWKDGRLHITADDQRSATIELESELPSGLNDLGDLALTRTAWIVSGCVSDPFGQPLANVQVEISRAEGPEGDDGDENWERVRSLDLETDERGCFERRGNAEPGRYRLEVDAERHLCDPVEFELGTQGLAVVLRAAGAIRGTLLVDEHIPVDELTVEVDPAEGEEFELDWRHRRAAVGADGSFLAAPLPFGSYRLSVSMGWNETVHEVPGPVLTQGAGETETTIDLRGALNVFRLALVTDPGRSVSSGTVSFGPAGTEERGDQWFHGDEVVLISAHAALDVDVHAAGFRASEVRGLRGDREVRLEGGTPVRVVLRGDGDVLEAPFGLSVGFIPREEGNHTFDWGAPRFDEQREIVVPATTTGAVKLVWVLEKASGNSAMAMSAEPEPEQLFHLTEGDSEQRIEVVLTREERERLMKQLEQ